MRRIIVMFVITVLIGGLAGCGKINVNEAPKKGITTKNTDNTGEQKETKINNEQNNEYDLRMINGGENYCSNENGYYYIDTHGDEYELKNGKTAHHIMYIDYATRKEVFLCNNAGCKHNTEACTAVITSEHMLDEILFFHNDKLYLLEKVYDDEGSTSYQSVTYSDEYLGLGVENDEDIPQTLYCMNPDGTGRKKVLEFEKGISIDDKVIEDNGGLYFIEKKIEMRQNGSKLEYAAATEKKLVRIDDASNKKETVCDLAFNDKENTAWQVMGCFDSHLVMDAYVMGHKLSEEEEIRTFEDENYDREIRKQSKMEYAVVDIRTGKMKTICSVSNENANSSVQKDKFLYVTVDGENNIRKIDLTNGKESCLAEIDKEVYLKIFDGKLQCIPWDENDKTSYFIDLKTEKVEKKMINLTTISLGWPIEFCGETEKDFLVVYDYKAHKAKSDPRDTGGDSYNIEQNKMALLSKEDFYNNKANYKPIDMIGSGGAN